MDTKFSVALHVLTMISESEKTLSSEDLARSVGTNASYIRKIITLLKGRHPQLPARQTRLPAHPLGREH